MGGAIKSITTNPIGTIKSGLSDTTGGLSKIISGKGQFKDFNNVGTNLAAGFTGSAWNKQFGGRVFDPMHGTGSDGAPSAPVIQGKQDPLSMLTMSGGAPLLTNIALGADVNTSLMGYFGASGDYKTWFNNLSDSDQQAVQGVHDQLTQIQTNTDLRNNAVKQLTNDFPNIMAQKIPQYSAMADEATKQMMTQALDQISAKQAAGGAFSSGATAAAAARAGAAIGMEKLQFGTNLAGADFANQYNNATALQSFQQKMLGQGATQGFNAVQNALARNAGIDTQQAQLQYNTGAAESQKQAGMWGALGSLGGTAIGAYFGGPAGAAVGSQAGKAAGTYFSSPQFNSDVKRT